MARKNAYYEKIEPNLENIKHWIYDGLSHKQIYEKIGVSETIFYKYLNFKKEFKEAVKKGNSSIQVDLEKALYKEAKGFEYEETHMEISDEETKLGKIRKQKQKKVSKYARANASLLMFALCNKFPEKWKRVDKEVIDLIENKMNLNITDEHIKDAFKALYPAIDENEAKKIIEEENDEDSES
jgi:hypothetical protein